MTKAPLHDLGKRDEQDSPVPRGVIESIERLRAPIIGAVVV